jgi:4-aminobutyrate aminotransferase-like enzyme/Ser/Thr protein kinase RdoA (MazF antagonist)
MNVLARNVPSLAARDIARAARDVFGLDGAVEGLESEYDQAVRLCGPGGDHLLKIAGAGRSRDAIELQVDALAHIARTDPSLAVPRIVPTVAGARYGSVTGPDGSTHLVQAFGWLPGTAAADGPQTALLRRSAGATCARLDRALRGFFHPAARREVAWDLRRVAEIAADTSPIESCETRTLVDEVVARLRADVLPGLDELPSQVIHHDANRHNLLVGPDDPGRVSAVIDFGDAMHAPRVMELAIACASLASGAGDPLRGIQEVAAGYDEVLTLEADEIDVLGELILGRLACAVAIAAARAAGAPGEPAYRDAPGAGGTPLLLATLAAAGPDRLRQLLRTACGFPQVPHRDTSPADRRADGEDLMVRRRRVLGARLSLSYPDRPLRVSRAEGVWLYDEAGRPHLDAYNNVPHVGHCHPHVVNAIARQTRCLATNARYLYPILVDYAERLVRLSGQGLNACFFVNSGSEANDVAWQMAKLATGREGALVMEDAYHGITLGSRLLSQRGPADRVASHVETVLAPDPYRGPFRAGTADLAARYASDVDRALGALGERGHAPAALIVDTGFCSNGIPAVPEGYLARACARTRARGGLVIADEVQMGLGRGGRHLWGYEAHGVVPDLVTLGKSVGNGFPLGVVIGRKEIVDQLAAFSTFGGNPVACAAGMATLDVVERDGLAEHAHVTGEHLRDGLRALARCHPAIGDVRGRGLMTGVELVDDPDARTPATDLARDVVQRMRDGGVLIGRTGHDKNVLKIRPPLVFTRDQADTVVEALGEALAAT